MIIPEVMAIHASTRVLQRTKFQIGHCYFSHAVPVRFEDEDWDVWLCEDRDTGAINAVNLELGYRGGLFFGASGSKLFLQFLDDLTLAYGPPQRWIMMRFERPTGRPEFGPGVCAASPKRVP